MKSASATKKEGLYDINEKRVRGRLGNRTCEH